jgi:hypothetical protein
MFGVTDPEVFALVGIVLGRRITIKKYRKYKGT